jgi:hypothetical protein
MPQITDVFRFAGKILTAKAVDPPKFDEIVKVVIATFAVFTGVAIKDYVASNVLQDQDWYAFVALVALLLRYIIGSAVHLTYTYARKEATAAEPNSASVLLLAKDFGFVVLFGVIAVRMAEAKDFAAFWFFAKCFLGAGLVWSITDCIVRFVWCKLAGNDNEWPKRPFWLPWAVLDAAQLFLTWAIPQACPLEASQAVTLAVVYALFLLVDLKVMARTLQVGLND